MSVFHDFKKNDIFTTRINGKPHVKAVFLNADNSKSLYGGIRARSDVSEDFNSGLIVQPIDELDSHSANKVITFTGKYPATGSVSFYGCWNTENEESDFQWYNKHFSVIDDTVKYYNQFDSNYYMGVDDFYSLFLISTDGISAPKVVYPNVITDLTDAFTFSCWVKIINGNYRLIVADTGGTISIGTADGFFAAYEASNDIVVTSTTQYKEGIWYHVTFTGEGNTLRLYVNGNLEKTETVNPFDVSSYASSDFAVGGNLNIQSFVFETKVWKRALTPSEINASMNVRESNVIDPDLIHYSKMNDGPMSVAHGHNPGLGVFDYSSYARHGEIVADNGPAYWMHGDHPNFVTDVEKGTTDSFFVFHVPSMFYEKKIDPGSVKVRVNFFNGLGISEVYQDDGRGNLYVSGSYTERITGEEYTGEKRRKVGNVLYSEGLVMIQDPAFLQRIAEDSPYFTETEESFSVEFDGQTTMNTKVFNCRIPASALNMSNNKTFSKIDENGRAVVKNPNVPIRISGIGLYDERQNLVAVAKFARPLRKRLKDKLNARLKLDTY